MKLITILVIFLSSNIYSQERSPYSFSVGAGVAVKQNIRNDNQYDKSDKSTEITPIPMAKIRLGPVSIAGPNIKLRLPRYKFAAPFIAVKRNGERYYGPGMDWRKDSWFAEVGLNLLMFQLTYARDIQGRSHGEVYNLTYNGRVMLGKVLFNYSFTHTFFDKEFTNYYYGVRQHEATSRRSSYSPGSSGSNSVALSPIWIINEKWSWFNSVKATFLESEIKDSPTVSRDWYFTMISGITYRL